MNPSIRFTANQDCPFGDWVPVELSSVAEYGKSRGSENNAYYVGTEDLLKEFQGVNLREVNVSEGVKFDAGDILIGNIRPYLKKLWQANVSGFCSADVLVIKPKNIDKVLLKYILSSDRFFKHIAEGCKGSKMPRGDRKQIMNYAFHIPSSQAEQEKIASFFSTLDEKISIKHKVLNSFENIKNGLMNKIFSQDIDLCKNNVWTASYLKDVLEVERGGSPRPIDKFLTNDDDGINWIKIGDAPIDGNRITSVKEKILRSGLSKTRLVRKGDLILSNSMSFGRPYILEVDGCIHDGWLAIKNDKKIFDIDFLVYLLASQEVKKQYKSLAGAGVVTNLNKELVNKVILQYPTLSEQKYIARVLLSVDKKINLLKKQIMSLKKIKTGFMQQMFV